MIHWIGNEAITYIPKTAMHSYFDFFMLNVSGLFMCIIMIHQHPKTLFSTSFWCESTKIWLQNMG